MREDCLLSRSGGGFLPFDRMALLGGCRRGLVQVPCPGSALEANLR